MSVLRELGSGGAAGSLRQLSRRVQEMAPAGGQRTRQRPHRRGGYGGGQVVQGGDNLRVTSREHQQARNNAGQGPLTSCSMLAESFLSVPASLPETRGEVRSRATRRALRASARRAAQDDAHDQAVRVPLATQEPRSTPRSERAVLRLGWGVSVTALPRARPFPVPG